MWSKRSANVLALSHRLVLSFVIVFGQASTVAANERPFGLDELRFGASSGPGTSILTLTKARPQEEFSGLLASIEDQTTNATNDIRVLVRCVNPDQPKRGHQRFFNATRNCQSFSVLSTGPVRLGIPYLRPEITDEIDEAAIKVFEIGSQVASLDALRPMESFLDRENKRTFTTLREQSGKFVAGGIKTIDAASKPPRLLDGKGLDDLKSIDPLTGVPLVQKPEVSPTGTLSLGYPLSFPGTRSGFAPSINVRYDSAAGYGNLGEGWRLDVPVISVETRWGVPLYSDKFETETYLLNGAQLLPEAGDHFASSPETALQLVPMPHRTTNLRPRKKGQARFVLRRDNELWRVIRHGDGPQDYWWEAWAEKPSGGAPRVQYFGRAPGRVPDFVEAVASTAKLDDGYAEAQSVLEVGSAGANAVVAPTTDTRWALAREVDAHGNLIDYFWDTTGTGNARWHDLHLKRVLYTSNLATEETVLRCRETLGEPNCKRRLATYEIGFDWIEPATGYLRSDGRSAGLVTRGALLSQIKVRGRQLAERVSANDLTVLTPNLGKKGNLWRCSTPFLGYKFEYRPELHGTGRMFLVNIAKATASGAVPFEVSTNGAGWDCSSFPGVTSSGDLVTRMEYDNVADHYKAQPWKQTATVEVPKALLKDSATVPLAQTVKGAILGSNETNGPLSSGILGTSQTTDVSASLYLGVNFFNPGKTNSFGVKSSSSMRTSYQESTLVIDINGDGLLDVVGRSGGAFQATLGAKNAEGEIILSNTVLPVAVPEGFNAFNREPFQSTRGTAFEAHILTAFLGSFKSDSRAVQDTYVQDVNADGRTDVVANGEVFFNTSRGNALSFSRTQDRSFVDDRDFGALPAAEAGEALLSAARTVLAADPPVSANDPRIDVVRYWRAPYSGEVIVRGEVLFDPPAEASDYRDVPADPDKILDDIRRKERRDGLHFTVELNKDRNWDGVGRVIRCFQTTFELPKAPDSGFAKLTSKGSGSLPEANCLVQSRPKWPTLPNLADFPAGLGRDDGIVLSVDAGDVVYFRIHSIDNAQDDVVSLDPQITYLRFAEQDFSASLVDPQAKAIYGLGNEAGAAIVAASGAFDFSTDCRAFEVTYPVNGGFSFVFDERESRLCDSAGRSLLRYVLVDEFDQFANASGQFVAPIDGQLAFSGKLSKPATQFGGEIVARIASRAPNAPTQATDGDACRPVDDGALGDLGQPGSDRFVTLLRFGPEAITEQSPLGEVNPAKLKVWKGDSFCLMLRLREPFDKQPTESPLGPYENCDVRRCGKVIVWPQDLTRFKWVGQPLAVQYSSKLLTVLADKQLSEEQIDALLPKADLDAPQLSDAECPAPRPGLGATTRPPSSFDLVELSDDVDAEATWNANKSGWEKPANVYTRCIGVDDRHWVAPRSIGAAPFGFSTPAAVKTDAPAFRLASRPASVRLPATDLACRPEHAASISSSRRPNREYRLRLDVETVGQLPNPSPLEMGIEFEQRSQHVATRRTVIAVVDGHLRRPIQAIPFTVDPGLDPLQPQLKWPEKVGVDYLTDMFTGTSLTDSKLVFQPSTFVIEQQARKFQVQLPTEPAPKTTTAFYSRFMVTPDASLPNDDGARFVPGDRIAYSICVPEGSQIEISSVIGDPRGLGAGVSDQVEKILRSGACAPNAVCPVSHTSVFGAGAFPEGGKRRIQPYRLSDNTYAERLTPLEPWSERGWGELALTTEFVEEELFDAGAKPDPGPAVPLTFSEADKFTEVANLPSVRTFSRLVSRFRTRSGPVSKGSEQNAMKNGPCVSVGNDPDMCKQRLFLSQMRVFPLTGSFKISASTQADEQAVEPVESISSGNASVNPSGTPPVGPNDWIYCTDNPHARAYTRTEVAAGVNKNQATQTVERVGLQTTDAHLCAIGPDRGIWGAGPFMSSSRIGKKSLANLEAEYLEKRAEIGAKEAKPEITASNTLPAGQLVVRMLPRVSTTSAKGYSAQFFGGVSQTSPKTNSILDVLDFNGDGFPDQLLGSNVLLSDPAGRFRCLIDGPWKDASGCDANGELSLPAPFSRDTNGKSTTISIPFSSPKTFLQQTASAAARLASGRSSTPTQSVEMRDPAWGLPLNLEFTNGESSRAKDFMDLNGDGLPDAIARVGSGLSVQLNLGRAVTAAQTWSGEILRERSSSIGLSGSIGYGDDKQSYGGGFSASTNSSRQGTILADINNDGLADEVTINGNNDVLAKINLGHDFSPAFPVTKLPALGGFSQGETDGVTASGFFTVSPCIPVPWGCIYLVINPGAGTGAAVNRQVITVRDFNGDGLQDIAVAGGLKVGDDVKLLFDNHQAKVLTNPFGTQGLLTKLFLPTNPEQERPSYEFSYALTTPSWDDPSGRRIFTRLTVWDGVELDNLVANQRRNTCFGYQTPFYDRFERVFLGFAQTTTIEGCGEVSVNISDAASAGVRKTVRTFANRSVYETGLLLSEETVDLAMPRVGGIQGGRRLVENTYVLVDVGASTPRQFVCASLNVQDEKLDDVTSSTKPKMAPQLQQGGRIEYPVLKTDGVAIGPCPLAPILGLEYGVQSDPEQERLIRQVDVRQPRRLMPVLVQTLQSTWEAGSIDVLQTAVQFAVDHLGRTVRMCDLGSLDNPSDDLCSDLKYADNLQLAFIHGATGGGTLAYDLRDRVSSIVVRRAAADETTLRRKTASYSREFGDLLGVCQFEKVDSSNDPCSVELFAPPVSVDLDKNRNSRVAVSIYEYDQLGNLKKFVSPIAADGYFMVRSFEYDDVIRQAMTAQDTEFCRLTSLGSRAGGRCPGGSVSTEGVFRSTSSDFDWRHGIARLECDVNANGIRTEFDQLGRPTKVTASWVTSTGLSESTAQKCNGDTTATETWGVLASYEYRVGVKTAEAESNDDISTVVGRTTRHVGGDKIIKLAGLQTTPSALTRLTTETHFDHLGRAVSSVTPGDVCVPALDPAVNGPCEGGRKDFMVSGLIKYDTLDRETEILLPQSVATIAPNIAAAVPVAAPVSISKSSIVYDGFDRPLSVKLSDKNGYAFRYLVSENDSGRPHHRVISRDPRCALRAVNRDLRGNVTSVDEYFHLALDGAYGRHALGSGSLEQTETIKVNGWVKDVQQVDISENSPFSQQQHVECNEGDAQVADGNVSIKKILDDPETNFGGSQLRSRTSYVYDELNQLTKVVLPAAAAGVDPSGSAIDVAYDALGRRIITSDPDRGIELLSYDLVSNVTCRRTGGRLRTGETLDDRIQMLLAERERLGDAQYGRLSGEDRCGAPANENKPWISRTIRTDYMFDRVSSIHYVDPVPVDGATKDPIFTYGKAIEADIVKNAAGRLVSVSDATGRLETKRYSALGMVEVAERKLFGLARGSTGANAEEIGVTRTTSAFDAWGMVRHSTTAGAFSALSRLGANDNDPAKQLTVAQATWYRYSPAGHVAEVIAGNPCKQSSDLPADWPEGTVGCSSEGQLTIIAETFFDERANPLRLDYGNGVSVRNTFAFDSNRLAASEARMGKSCDTAATSDVCLNQLPPIKFQNLTYSYDAAGQVIGYRNEPGYIDTCTVYAETELCDQLSRDHAAAYGMLVSGSLNEFSYDEVGRLVSSSKTVRTFGDKANEMTLSPEQAVWEPLSFLKFEEHYRFTDSHLLTGIRRSFSGAEVGQSTPLDEPVAHGAEQIFEIQHSYDKAGPTAVDSTRIEKPSKPSREMLAFTHDDAGRLANTRCTGCLLKAAGEKNYISNRYGWDPDDTLALTSRRIEPQPGASTGRRYFVDTQQSYDHEGNRVIKRTSGRIEPARPGAAMGDTVETIYATDTLTVVRRSNGKPEAVYHIMAGPARIATKLAGSNVLFTYHAQLATRSVSDVVYSNGMDANTARIHKQMEYVPFGEVVIGREMPIASANPVGDGNHTGQGTRLGQPTYRFDAKEYDEETALTYFGSRHYDQRLGLWLSPDPILGDYLEGSPNGGVFDSRNLAAYGFGWGNPVGYVDVDGNVIMFAPLIPIAINAGRAAVMDAAQGYALQALEIQLGQRTGFDHAEIAKGAAFAAVSGGFSSFRKAERVGQLAIAANASVSKGTKSRPLHVLYSFIWNGEVYVGRTSGKGVADQIVKKRIQAHAKRLGGKIDDVEVHAETFSRRAIRGAEDLAIEAAGGAKSMGGSAANANRGVSPYNRKLGDYWREGDKISPTEPGRRINTE